MSREVRSLHRQRGVALIVAILLVALGTIIAAAMAYNNAMTERRTAATFDFDQALLYAQGAEAFAAYGLKQQLRSDATYTYPAQSWGQHMPPQEVAPGVTMEAWLEDLQGRFNVNSLVDPNTDQVNPIAYAVFRQLLVSRHLDVKWAPYLVDWIDSNTIPMYPEGAEDSVYMEANPPYRTSNRPITSASELMALPGFTRADFDAISPYIVALPPGVPLNVCSAAPLVLDAFLGVQQFSVDTQFDQNRATAGGCFPKLSDFMAAYNGTKHSYPNPNPTSPQVGGIGGGGSQPQTIQPLLDQKSSWFRLTTVVESGSTEFTIYSLLYLDRNTGMVRPVMRSFTPD